MGKRSGGQSTSSAISTSTSDDDAVFDAKSEPEKDMEIETGDRKKKITMGAKDNNEKKLVKAAISRNREAAEASNKGPRFKDLIGIDNVLEQLKHDVLAPLYGKTLEFLGINRPMTGILLHGPPGCGKTKLAHAIANEIGASFYKISATEVVSGVSGASEENIRDIFKKAHRTAPSIIFIDEIDAIASKRKNLLMTCMDESHQPTQSNDDLEGESSETKPKHVFVIGATNRPDAVDQALRRFGRFGLEISLGVPDAIARYEILSLQIKKLRVEGSFDLMKIARSTPGFVGADLAALVKKASSLAIRRIADRRRSVFEGEMLDCWWKQPWSQEEMNNLFISMSDFEDAVKMVQPSSRREEFSSIPSTKWDDVGGLESVRKVFELHIVQRIRKPEDFEELGVDMAVGFLLFGPPGCGKTLIAKAVANEAGANFIHIKGAELLNKYDGESEPVVRTIFARARTCSPCILFFDEVDALTTLRGRDGEWVVTRLHNQLLIELDDADHRQGVYVIGATNRIEVIDPAVLRPGRFGKIFYVPLPNGGQRGLILKALGCGKPIAADVDLEAIGRMDACHNLTGADLSAVINGSFMIALDEKEIAVQNGTWNVGRPLVIERSHLEAALMRTFPSVSDEERLRYDNLANNYNAIL